MFKFFFKKEQQVESLIFRYLDNLKMTQENFLRAMDVYFEKGFCERRHTRWSRRQMISDTRSKP
jgi:hypothetical protein